MLSRAQLHHPRVLFITAAAYKHTNTLAHAHTCKVNVVSLSL